MAGSYYDRNTARAIDGSPIFKTQEDEDNERSAAAEIESAWRCKLHSFGKLSPIDWYAERDGRVVGILELKARTHESGTYPTVFLNVRKWLALLLGSAGMGVPAMFVVKFTNALMFVDVTKISGSQVRVGGCSRTVKSRSDVEPVIEVPISQMHTIQRSADPPSTGSSDALADSRRRL